MQQWQRYMQQHAVAEGRSPSQITQDKHRGLWQAQIDKVRSEEQQLGNKFSAIQNNRQKEISNILTDNIASKDGIKEIIKHLLKAKIEEAKVEKSEKSVLEQLIQSSQKITSDSHQGNLCHFWTICQQSTVQIKKPLCLTMNILMNWKMLKMNMNMTTRI